MPQKIVIISPTYNEKDNVRKLATEINNAISDVKDFDFTLLFVDDSSPDGTLDEIIRLKKTKFNNLNIEYISRDTKDGLGKAYLAGMDYAMDKLGCGYIIQMDADLSHQPKYLLGFADSFRGGADLVVASRYIEGGGTPGWPWHRKLISKFGNYYNRFFLGSKLTDYTGGFNGYSSKLLEELIASNIESSGYGFMTEAKFKALKLAKSPKQVPIQFIDREHGKSKIPKSTIFKSFLLAPKLRFKYGKN